MRAPRDGCACEIDSRAPIAEKAPVVGVNDGEHTMQRSILCAAALALVGTAFQAQAGDINSQRQIVVSYDDINIHQPAGARILLTRIDVAARNVCGPTPDMRQLGAWETYRACTKTATDNAMSALPFNLMAMIERPQAETLASR